MVRIELFGKAHEVTLTCQLDPISDGVWWTATLTKEGFRADGLWIDVPTEALGRTIDVAVRKLIEVATEARERRSVCGMVVQYRPG